MTYLLLSSVIKHKLSVDKLVLVCVCVCSFRGNKCGLWKTCDWCLFKLSKQHELQLCAFLERLCAVEGGGPQGAAQPCLQTGRLHGGHVFTPRLPVWCGDCECPQETARFRQRDQKTTVPQIQVKPPSLWLQRRIWVRGCWAWLHTSTNAVW